MSEEKPWLVVLINDLIPGAAATPKGLFATQEEADAWIAGQPEDVRERARLIHNG